MCAKAGISVAEYLHTSFPDLDREYRDGELVERSVPDYLHGRTQALLLVFFEALRKKLSFYACSETRVKVREGLYLIPDVSVFRRPNNHNHGYNLLQCRKRVHCFFDL
ncbi:MAG: Uma2 family endonuclease [Acidobacteriota bacterium]|nr:Uma2 family endonuclease [Acidobacteriota bacterium]